MQVDVKVKRSRERKARSLSLGGERVEASILGYLLVTDGLVMPQTYYKELMSMARDSASVTDP